MSQQTDIQVLITTDTPESLRELTNTLTADPDIKVIGLATSGAEAIEKAKAHNPDIVLMDYDMPGLDGAEATQIILKENDRIQVVMLSVVNDADDIRHAMRAGARDYLVKPLRDGELVETIRWMIRERRDYARIQSFVQKMRKAYEALFTDDKPVPDTVIAFLEQQVQQKPGDRLAIETLAVSYARNREWQKLLPLAEILAE